MEASGYKKKMLLGSCKGWMGEAEKVIERLGSAHRGPGSRCRGPTQLLQGD